MIRQLFLSFLLIQTTVSAARGKGRIYPANVPPPGKKWLTLNGGEPVVIARGGFSGIAPESSNPAYTLALQTGLASTILLCDLQFSKDAEGFCQYNLNLQNSSDISTVFQNLKPKTYNINGRNVEGWFGVDFLADDLFKKVSLMQSIYSRSPSLDGGFPLLSPYDIVALQGSPRLWINAEYPSFYDGLKISASSYILDTMRDLNPAYISSPEIGFLKGLVGKVNPTKLILKIPDLNEVEPTTKKTYVTLLSDINMIKTFASGIILPKDSIWPINSGRLLLPATSFVSDFHKAGLEVYASGFANDNFLSYNYSYDPTKEYLQFIDNSQFSVDGVITDFPATASESIACLAQNKNASKIVKTLIMSHDGASGDYPGSTDLAYQKAVDDGAEIIDCSVQLSKDGVAFCLPSADLSGTTTAASLFLDRSTKIHNAAYLAANKGLDIVGVVTTALTNATLDKQSTQRVLIQSDDSSVLLKFQEIKTYQRVLIIKKDISGTTQQTAQEVKKYADGVKVFRNSIVLDYPNPVFMSLSFSNLVEVMHAANISVYVGVLRNEFQNFLFDYYADPYVELATFTQKGVDGIATDYPTTANAYMRSPCSNPNANLPYTILPINPGDMYNNLVTAKPPQAAPPVPLLETADVVDPALPPVAKISESTPASPSDSGSNSSPAPAPKHSRSTKTACNTGLMIAAVVGVIAILSFVSKKSSQFWIQNIISKSTKTNFLQVAGLFIKLEKGRLRLEYNIKTKAKTAMAANNSCLAREIRKNPKGKMNKQINIIPISLLSPPNIPYRPSRVYQAKLRKSSKS